MTSTSGATGSTYKGNDIERFYRYGLLVNPELKIYKPWLDATFIDELGDGRDVAFMQKSWLWIQDVAEKAYSTDSNILARPTRRKTLSADKQHEYRRADYGAAFCATTLRSSAKRLLCGFEEGSRLRERDGICGPCCLAAGANRIGGPPRSGHDDQIETASSRPEPRHLRVAGLALLYIAYER